MYALLNKNKELIDQSEYLGVILLEVSVQIEESFHSKGFWLEPVFRQRKIGFVQYEIKETDYSSEVKYVIVKNKENNL